MKLRITFFAAARDAVGTDEVELELSSAPTTAELRQRLLSDYPDLRPLGHALHIAVNSDYASEDRVLADSDEVVCFPPVSGG